LRPAHHLDPREQVAGQQFEARLVAGGRIVEADAVDEEQGVIGFGAAEADLGLGAARSSGRDGDAGSEAEQVRRIGQIERLDLLLADDG